MERPIRQLILAMPVDPYVQIVRYDGQSSVGYSRIIGGQLYESLYDYMESTTGKQRWNDCSHYTKTSSFNGGSTWAVINGSGGTSEYDYVGLRNKAINIGVYGQYDQPFTGLAVLFDRTTKRVFTPVDLSDYKDRALDAMLPGIRPKLSLVNSVIELKDFRSLPETIHKVLSVNNQLKTLVNRVKHGRLPRQSVLWRRPLWHIAKAVADVFLQKEFNIDPLMSDVRAIHSSIVNIRRQIKHLLENEGETQVKHYRAPILSLLNESNSQNVSGGGWSAPNMEFLVDGVYYGPYVTPTLQHAQVWAYRNVEYEAFFSASLEYSYTLDQYVRDNADTYGLLDSLGVNFNPQIVWNAIPWSFVVDWVIDVSRWLGRYKIRLIEPRTTITRFLWSVNVHRKVSTSIEVKPDGHYLGSGVVPTWEHIEKAYIRLNDVPLIHNSLMRSGISLKEFVLGGALGIATHRVNP